MEWITQLQQIVGKDHVKQSRAQLAAYSFDATAGFQAMPDAVVSPESTEQIAAIMNVCRTYKVPLVPRGSGTNLAAGTVPSQGGIVLCLIE